MARPIEVRRVDLDGVVEFASGPLDEPRPVASVSKQFVASVVVALAARGVLAFDDPLDRWFGRWAAPITLHHLLTHTAGLGHWSAVGGAASFCQLNSSDRLDAIEQAPTVAGPGETWSYSGLGYVLIAELVERCTDRPYADVLRREVLDPAGLDATTSGGDGLRSLPGSGDLVSTANDLARWTQRCPDLTATTVSLGAGASTAGVVTATSYGLGVYTGTIANQPAWFHSGDVPGHQSMVAKLSGSATIVVLVDDDHVSLTGIVADLTSGM